MVTWTEFTFILKPSSIGGVGVFTTHDLPKDMQIFLGKHCPKKRTIKEVPEAFLKYCIFLNDEECISPERFDRMEIGWFLNHSDKPNITKTAEGRVITLRDIQAGEEILMDYNELNEPEHLKESYYKI